jgi:hypothetical protein
MSGSRPTSHKPSASSSAGASSIIEKDTAKASRKATSPGTATRK